MAADFRAVGHSWSLAAPSDELRAGRRVMLGASGNVRVRVYNIAVEDCSSKGPLACSAAKSGGITLGDPRDLPAGTRWLAIA